MLAGCSSPAPALPGSTAADDLATRALAAFERSDWGAAAPLLREAIARNPAPLRLHFALAITATHLDLRDEAIREFEWVLANGAPGTAEALTARKWLTDAGVLAAAPPANVAAAAPEEETVSPTTAALRGQVVWNESDPPVSIARLQLFLTGIEGTPTKEEYRVVRTDRDGRFEFKQLVPGPYRLMNRIAGKPTWRLRVQVEAGQRLALDLTPDNSTRARDDFPKDE